MKYALDTNIITYYLKGIQPILDRVDAEAENDNIVIPPFAYFEIKKWLEINNSKIKLKAFKQLFSNYGIDIIDKTLFDQAVSFFVLLRKKGITIDDGDLLIAAYCIKNDCILVSNNARHFEQIPGLRFETWIES